MYSRKSASDYILEVVGSIEPIRLLLLFMCLKNDRRLRVKDRYLRLVVVDRRKKICVQQQLRGTNFFQFLVIVIGSTIFHLTLSLVDLWRIVLEVVEQKKIICSTTSKSSSCLSLKRCSKNLWPPVMPLYSMK